MDPYRVNWPYAPFKQKTYKGVYVVATLGKSTQTNNTPLGGTGESRTC